MSHQGEDGWYPECRICGNGNISEIICLDCFETVKKKLKEQISQLEVGDEVYNQLTLQDEQVLLLSEENKMLKQKIKDLKSSMGIIGV